MLHSLSAQVSYYSNLIQKNPGMGIHVGVYIDEAVTGTKDVRDDFRRLLDDCRAGKIDLSPNEVYLSLCPEYGYATRNGT